MSIKKINILFGETVNLGNYNSKRMELGLEIDITDKEGQFEDHYVLAKELIESKLLQWKKDLTNGSESSRINFSKKNYSNSGKYHAKPKIDTYSKLQTTEHELICPECQEYMVQKPGKQYFTCSKHWAYPDMVAKGIVKEKKPFIKSQMR